jgi:hypothetical protein
MLFIDASPPAIDFSSPRFTLPTPTDFFLSGVQNYVQAASGFGRGGGGGSLPDFLTQLLLNTANVIVNVKTQLLHILSKEALQLKILPNSTRMEFSTFIYLRIFRMVSKMLR